jgi:hypothetical protein
MLRRRPSRTSWVRHPVTQWLMLATLYLVAAVTNLLLALRMRAVWPALLATVMAVVTGLCVAAALRRYYRGK